MKFRIASVAVLALLSLTLVALAATAVKMPFPVYADGQKELPYISSGWIGNTEAIAMTEKCTDKPHSGKNCIRVDYKALTKWGGIVWQSPANDWGDVDGGFNLSNAKKLTFWARGAKGGEKVKFGFGFIKNDKKFPDSAKGSIEETLKADWTEYYIDLKGLDLSKIKTGFYWIVAGQGDPVTFYLDDIQYE